MAVVNNLVKNPVHLGLGATATVEPLFTGAMDWYADYAARHTSDGTEGRLVSMHSFSENWDVWEMHPLGSEVVLCISGQITLHQQRDGEEILSHSIGPGEYIVNAAGVWHTADVAGTSSALFITAGEGTEHRPRSQSDDFKS